MRHYLQFLHWGAFMERMSGLVLCAVTSAVAATTALPWWLAWPEEDPTAPLWCPAPPLPASIPAASLWDECAGLKPAWFVLSSFAGKPSFAPEVGKLPQGLSTPCSLRGKSAHLPHVGCQWPHCPLPPSWLQPYGEEAVPTVWEGAGKIPLGAPSREMWSQKSHQPHSAISCHSWGYPPATFRDQVHGSDPFFPLGQTLSSTVLGQGEAVQRQGHQNVAHCCVGLVACCLRADFLPRWAEAKVWPARAAEEAAPWYLGPRSCLDSPE